MLHDVRPVPHEFKLSYPQRFFGLIIQDDQVTLSVQLRIARLIILNLDTSRHINAAHQDSLGVQGVVQDWKCQVGA
jgi:hypothetical protein